MPLRRQVALGDSFTERLWDVPTASPRSKAGSAEMRPDRRMWSGDRNHLTTEDHRRVAQGALTALSPPPDDSGWDDPLAPLPPLG